MSEHHGSDTSRVYHNGRDAAHASTHAVHASTDAAAPAAGPATQAGAPAGDVPGARMRGPAIPERFALYADSEATEDLADAELLQSAAFDLADVVVWGLENARAAVAHRESDGSVPREHFVCESAERVRALLELAGHGPLRVLYL